MQHTEGNRPTQISFIVPLSQELQKQSNQPRERDGFSLNNPTHIWRTIVYCHLLSSPSDDIRKIHLPSTCFLLKGQRHQASSLPGQLLLSSHDTEFFSLAETLKQQFIGSSFSMRCRWTTWIVTICWFASSFISL